MSESDLDRTSWRRQWAVVITIVLVPLLLLGWLILFYDIEPPDESAALPLRPLTVRMETDPLVMFSKAQHLAAEAFSADWSAAVTRGSPMVGWDEGAMAEMVAFVEKHRGLNEAFWQLAEVEGPLYWPGVDEEFTVDRPMGNFKTLQDAANSARLQLELLSKQDRTAEVLERALQHLEISSKLMRGEGTLLHWLIALNLRKVALNHIAANLIGVTDELGRRFEEAELLSTDFAACLRVEHLGFSNTVGARSTLPGGGAWVPMKTNLLLYESCAERAPLYEALEKSWEEALPAVRGYESLLQWRQAHPWRRRLHVNLVGRMAIDAGGSSLVGLWTTTLEVLALERCIGLALRLREVELESGVLEDPSRMLSEMPLDAWRTDPLTNASLGWNAARGAIYSVGRDRVDNGGDVSTSFPFKKTKDIGLIYPGFGSGETP